MVNSEVSTDQVHAGTGVDQHAIRELITAVNRTHPGLGALAAITMVAAKARKCTLIVGPPGTGKSAVVRWLGRTLPEAYIRGDLTMAALRKYTDELTNSKAAILVDDIGACNSDWNRIQTCVSLAELVYGHEMVKDTHQIKVEILDFYGAAVLGVQPNVLSEVVKHPSWHSNLADKSMRYYHLQRPLAPSREEINVECDWGEDFDDVLDWDGDSNLWSDLMDIGLEQWSYARAIEHLGDLAKAIAALCGRYTVEEQDLAVLLDLIRPMTVEMNAVQKLGFGSEATLNQNLIYLLAEFASYPIVTYEIIGNDYHLRPRQVQRILEDMHDWYYKVNQNPVKLIPTELLREVLQRAGVR